MVDIKLIPSLMVFSGKFEKKQVYDDYDKVMCHVAIDVNEDYFDR
ncbi:unnamed protein product, partial [Rotaria sp. Silwood1]